jgi:hypothetical protein
MQNNFHSPRSTPPPPPRMQTAGQEFQTLQQQIQRNNFHSPRSAPPPPQRNNNVQNTSVWDHAIVVVILGTTLTGVQGSRPIRLQLQEQIRISTAMLTTVQPLQQGRIKLVLA